MVNFASLENLKQMNAVGTGFLHQQEVVLDDF